MILFVLLTVGSSEDLARWRNKLFVATSHSTADAAEHFALPRDRSVVTGSRISV